MTSTLKNRPRPYSTRKNPTKKEVAWFNWCKDLEAYLRQIVEPCKEGHSKPYIPLGKEEGVVWLAKKLLGEPTP